MMTNALHECVFPDHPECSHKHHYGPLDLFTVPGLFERCTHKLEVTMDRAEVAVTIPLPKPVQAFRKSSINEAALVNYVALAEELGLKNRALDEVRIKQILAAEDILIYPEPQVADFLRAHAKKELGPNGTWVWKPLFEEKRDAEVNRSRNVLMQQQAGFTPTVWLVSGGPPTSAMYEGERKLSVYEKPVPMSALLLVKKIRALIPTADFYVSDYAVLNPDPFLMFTVNGGPVYIVAHWDEPEFDLTASLLKR